MSSGCSFFAYLVRRCDSSVGDWLTLVRVSAVGRRRDGRAAAPVALFTDVTAAGAVAL